MASRSEPFPARSDDDLGVADDFFTFVTDTRRMLEGTSIDSPVKKRAKTISSHEVDLTLNHVAAFLEDTRRTGKLYVWYKAHQKLYDYLQARRAKMPAHSSIDNKVDTPGHEVTKHNDLDISENGDTHQSHFEVLLGRLETALEKLYRETHDKNQQNVAEAPTSRTTTDSPFSNLPDPRVRTIPAPPPTESSLRNKTIENSSALNGSEAEPPRRRKARGYVPARRSRGTAKGGFISCTPVPLTSTSKNTTSEPKPEPEPLPLPSPKFINCKQSNIRPKAVPGTKAERLAEYMKYWKRAGGLDEEEESHERREN
ncbi:hypothetical protein NCU05673 [Neurospora crassa OR74A]|uniref:Uncharacterized protein n=1 Tax=Neurospora crassa (strain ATCC 24698 / 74-OR23-1A / CBS 708.71 / DSM 1257 / FGSC 987) TaxID=367110 RepID=Q7SAZ1_NEUCR|nr:hypothetical protein NCU05673 [Neurospora crassa OR74A]EAA33551.1 hypothetical protein NCU05673 [Neurospora crassa OR74A]|eukprot:XP_962787.1 hypothetical protein NCU05673 [Neurospora crassa OR74A]